MGVRKARRQPPQNKSLVVSHWEAGRGGGRGEERPRRSEVRRGFGRVGNGRCRSGVKVRNACVVCWACGRRAPRRQLVVVVVAAAALAVGGGDGGHLRGATAGSLPVVAKQGVWAEGPQTYGNAQRTVGCTQRRMRGRRAGAGLYGIKGCMATPRRGWSPQQGWRIRIVLNSDCTIRPALSSPPRTECGSSSERERKDRDVKDAPLCSTGGPSCGAGPQQGCRAKFKSRARSTRRSASAWTDGRRGDRRAPRHKATPGHTHSEPHAAASAQRSYRGRPSRNEVRPLTRSPRSKREPTGNATAGGERPPSCGFHLHTGSFLRLPPPPSCGCRRR
jgi:hypothetical protein